MTTDHTSTPRSAGTTSFAAGDTFAYVFPQLIVLVGEPLPDADVTAVGCAGSLAEVADRLVDLPDVAIVVVGADAVETRVRGDAFDVVVDGSHVGSGRFEEASIVRVGTFDAVAGTSTPFAIDVGLVPAAVVERRLGPPVDDADPFAAVFGATVDRSIEAAAVRETLTEPAAAILVGHDGRRIPLDRPVVFGRSPRREPDDRNARVIALPEPDISRRHASIGLERWSAVVVDLGSTNGTTIEMPGRRPEQLVPDRARPMVLGTVLRLGSERVFTLEAAA